CDDVQRSIELLDRVLSEFDDVENANQVQNIPMSGSASTPHLQQQASTPINALSTPEDESPSLGHQSEDDGYMSMNGRKAKFNLAFKPLTEVPVHQEVIPGDPNDFPPPPEEAQRLIATLLPKVSPAHSSKRNGNKPRTSPITQPRIETIPPPQRFQNHEFTPVVNGLPEKHSATQTTLPKTRHQRPFGWENDFIVHPLPPPGYRFGSLPFQHGVYPLTSPTRVPPRTVPSAAEKHREVRRRGSEDTLSCDLDDQQPLRTLRELGDDEHFSDDSLEEMLPPPPPVNKRASIAWEVPIDNEDGFMTPGSTKVIGRRRHKSGSQSSTSSIPNRLKEFDDWPDPPPCTTEDEITSPFSDSDDVILPQELSGSNLSGTGTYIVRRGKKERKILQHLSSSMNSSSSLNSRLSSDLSIPHSRFSADLNSRLSRELSTPNSRYSIDLSTPHSRLSQELNSPKSRFSLDLNNSRQLSQEMISSPSRMSADLSSSRSSTPQSKQEFKKHSTTFDNIKSLIKEGVIEHYNGPQIESTKELNAMVNPIVRVVSLPSLNAEELTPRRELAVTVEEEEDGDSSPSSSSNTDNISPLRKIEQNISELLERRDIEVSSMIQDDKCVLTVNGVDKTLSNEKKKRPAPSKSQKQENELQKSNSHNEIQRSEDYYRQLLIEGGNMNQYKRPGIQKSESAKEMLISHKEKEIRNIPISNSADFPVRVEVLDFPPLPPSPVEEDDDEYSEILQNASSKPRADTLPITSECAPAVPPHREPTNSLKTRSMDAGYTRGRRTYMNTSNRIPERRTLPTEHQETKRKFYQKRSSHSPQEDHHMQTSCSLPETPIFARGCDIPRTPHRRAPEIPGLSGNQTAPRQSSTMSSINTIGNMSTGGIRRGISNMEQAYVGAELLRMAGGPGRGWYPKQRQRRPASIEHLDRLASGHNPWDSSRKPLTLPPNLTPKFFQRSPRDALRRVTSLLIKKGNNPKEGKKEKELVSPTIHENANTSEETQKKKSFFKNFWKRSRHYSLEQQQQQ
ncbi:PREDICTED: uncharacterized protein LOC108569380, partial [Nicrophorus vespilloides]|uniref:Uncharacterized protein LOC108569380 n=1 Tax=Nicrophorus vespilloides TaxID=110193 RepID=A0ABM1NHU4_NICVS